jgi:hypothetical protein
MGFFLVESGPADRIMPAEPEKALQGLTSAIPSAAEAAFQFQTGVSNPWSVGASVTSGTAGNTQMITRMARIGNKLA